MTSVNSEDYWDQRFKQDWDSKQGDKQSIFFMDLALDMLPAWYKDYLGKHKTSFLDWGCAEGDGTSMLAEAFPKCQVEGIDFAVTAIDSASSRYKHKNLHFTAVDLLTTKHTQRYDTVFSSNVFEHFHETWKVADKMLTFAEKFFIMLIPFNEDADNLWGEHFHSFARDQFPMQMRKGGDEWRLVHFEVRNTAILPVTYWVGQQALVIFAREDVARELDLNFGDVNLVGDRNQDTELELYRLKAEHKKLKEIIEEQDTQLHEHEFQLELSRQRLGQAASVRHHDFSGVVEGLAGRFVPVEPARSHAKRLARGVHRRLNGRARDRRTVQLKQLLEESGYFNREFYLANNPDVAQSAMDPLDHYLKHGYMEGREPSLLFDQAYYVAMNPDVDPTQVLPLEHFLRHGQKEGRQPKPPFVVAPDDKRLALAFQLDSFDRGGLEEVVLMLASDPEMNAKYRIYVFVSGDGTGYLAQLARDRGINVIGLNHNLAYLDQLVKKLDIKLCNLHYSVFGVSVYKRNNTKLAYTIHNNYIWADQHFINARKPVYRKIDEFIAVSGQVADFFAAKFDIDRNKIDVVTNGLNVADAEEVVPQKRSRFGIEEKDFLFIDVASFTANKFHVSLIASMADVVREQPRAKLLLAGNIIDHEYYQVVEDMIAKYDLKDHVTIVDYMPKKELLGLLQVADCFVMPSLTEGFSIAMLEAMYHKLPMVATDVGGARHAIADSDIGLVVDNAYDDMQVLTNDRIRRDYIDDSHLSNRQALSEAMLDMVTNAKEWKQRAKKARTKVLDHFQAKHVVEGYLREFEQAVFASDDRVSASFEAELQAALAQLQTVFFAPYPTAERVTEGWMSRIKAIDSIIGGTSKRKAKVYVNVSLDASPPVVTQHDDHGWEITLGRHSAYYVAVIQRLIDRTNAAYVHTLHLAEHALPWLDSGKIVVDFHGVTPEEEVMMGRTYLKEKYEDIEQRVLAGAATCVMVTQAMAKHYADKYPKLKPRKLIILPIIENLKTYDRAIEATTKYEVVYSGGTQAWQNVEAMMKLVDHMSDNAHMTFLSHDWRYLEETGKAAGLPDDTTYEFCDKATLRKRYVDFDYGLVLRDDTAVNRVACPTKLYEYMKYGIVPIVRSEAMGDFKTFGYGYVTETDISAGQWPTLAHRREIIKSNYRAVAKMESTFHKGSEQLRRLFI